METVKNPRRCEKCGRHIYSMYDGWQPIETAPKDGTVFLAKEGNNYYGCSFYYYDEDEHKTFWSSYCGQPVAYSPEPTKWMPLFAGPGAGEILTDNGTKILVTRQMCITFLKNWYGPLYPTMTERVDRYETAIRNVKVCLQSTFEEHGI